MTILGIDFGRRYIGLAVSYGLIPEPLEVTVNKKGVFKKIEEVAKLYGIEKIVLGLPEGILEKEIYGFGQELAKRLKLPVFYVSEVYSTREAQQKLIEQGKRRRKRKAKSHAFSAALILESFLREQTNDEG